MADELSEHAYLEAAAATHRKPWPDPRPKHTPDGYSTVLPEDADAGASYVLHRMLERGNPSGGIPRHTPKSEEEAFRNWVREKMVEIQQQIDDLRLIVTQPTGTIRWMDIDPSEIRESVGEEFQ